VKALRAEEFGKMGIGKRTAAGIAGNLGKGGYAKKGLAVAALGSTVYFGSGLLADLGRVVGIVPKKRDANGEEVSTGFTDIAIDAGGTAASLAVAAIGGKAHALGH